MSSSFIMASMFMNYEKLKKKLQKKNQDQKKTTGAIPLQRPEFLKHSIPSLRRTESQYWYKTNLQGGKYEILS